MMMRATLLAIAISALSVIASPAVESLEVREDVQNIVYVTDAEKFCKRTLYLYGCDAMTYSPITISIIGLIVPRDPHTNIGDSEHPGGMKTYCSPKGRYSSQQGLSSL
jgi:hypothetical protein